MFFILCKHNLSFQVDYDFHKMYEKHSNMLYQNWASHKQRLTMMLNSNMKDKKNLDMYRRAMNNITAGIGTFYICEY